MRFFQAFIYFEGGTQPNVFFNSEIELTAIIQIGLFLAGLVVSDAMFVSLCFEPYPISTSILFFFFLITFLVIDLSPVGYLEPQHLRCAPSHLYRYSLGRYVACIPSFAILPATDVHFFSL